MKQKGFTPIVLLVLVGFVVVGIGAYYFGTQSSSTPSLNDSFSSPEPSTDNDIKTYTSSTMNFSVKYPSYYLLKEIDDLGVNDKRAVFLAESGDVGLSGFSIFTSSNELPQYPYDQEPSGKYTIDGIEGIYAELPKGYGDGGDFAPSPLLAVYVEKNGTLYQFNFNGVSSIEDKRVRQILASIQFAE